jgi:methionine-rich copper-binding protein CopC
MSIFSFSKSVTAVALISLFSLPALAHPALKSMSPMADEGGSSAPADKVAETSPKEIKLTFSESVVAKFSGVEVTDKDGKSVATGAPTTNATDAKQLIIPLSTPLIAGKYTVIWHAVSEDTHRVKGQYSFTIAQ